MKSRELRSTCYRASLSAATFWVSRQSLHASTSRWSPELDTFVTLTRSLIFQSFPLVRSSRLLGMESSFSCVVSLSQKSRTLTPSLIQPSLIRFQSLPYQTPSTLRFLCAQLFALILVAFPFPILVPTRVGSVSATVPSTINSAEWDRVPPRPTCPTLTTQSTDPLSALRSKSSPTSHRSSSTFEQRAGTATVSPRPPDDRQTVVRNLSVNQTHTAAIFALPTFRH